MQQVKEQLEREGIPVQHVKSKQLYKAIRAGKEFDKNARLLTDRVFVEYDCGCFNLAPIQIDSVQKNMNIEIHFKCEKCKIGEPVILIIGKGSFPANKARAIHDEYSQHPPNCSCTGAAVPIPLKEYNKLTKGL